MARSQVEFLRSGCKIRGPQNITGAQFLPGWHAPVTRLSAAGGLGKGTDAVSAGELPSKRVLV